MFFRCDVAPACAVGTSPCYSTNRVRIIGRVICFGPEPATNRVPHKHAPYMASVPRHVPPHGDPATAAPCHHSRDRPAPKRRGRDQLRQAAFSPKANTRVAKRLGFHFVKANLEGDSGPPRDGREPRWARPCEANGALFLSNGGTGGGHAACTLWPPKVGFRLAKAKSLCDLRIRLWRIRSLWRPLGTFPRGESTSSARRRTKPLTRNGFLMDGKEGGFLAQRVEKVVKTTFSRKQIRSTRGRPNL